MFFIANFVLSFKFLSLLQSNRDDAVKNHQVKILYFCIR